MARIIDVIEYPNEMAEEIVHRFPQGGGVADYRLGSQVIVRESQRVVFFRDGTALDVFGPGRHTIATANVPLITQKLQDIFTSGKTVFPAEVFFVSAKEFANRKWGTPQPIIVRNPGMGLGVALLQGFGSYSYQVGDPQQFVTQIVGAQGAYNTNQIEDRLRTMLLSILQDVLGETTAAKSVVDLIGLTEELGAAVRAKAQDDFEAIGLNSQDVLHRKPETVRQISPGTARYGHAGYGHLHPTASCGRHARCGSESQRRRRADGWHRCRYGYREFDAAGNFGRNPVWSATTANFERRRRRYAGCDDPLRSGLLFESFRRRCSRCH